MANVHVYAGPVRRPLCVGAERWCHGILPRGLMSAADDSTSAWRTAAPLVEAVLGGDAVLAPDHPAQQWVAAARAARVVSLRAASEIAIAAAVARSGDRDADVWLVKEGHTASVWQLRIAGEVPLCLNIARDASAATELERSAVALRRWHERAPDRVVAIHDIRHDEFATTRGEVETTVVTSAWIDGLELHLPVRPGDRLVEIGWFDTAEERDPGIQRVLGRWIDGVEADRVWEAIADTTERLATREPDGTWRVPAFHINDGDWVLADAGPVLVASAEDACPIAEHDLARLHPATWRRIAERLHHTP